MLRSLKLYKLAFINAIFFKYALIKQKMIAVIKKLEIENIVLPIVRFLIIKNWNFNQSK